MNESPGHADVAIEARGLSKHYGARTVLDDVSLSIPVGETFALLGPNGAGKSTTVGIMTGVVRPSAGSVRVIGSDPIAGSRAWRARIGVVSQTTGDTGPYTVAELVRHYASLYPNPRDPDAVIAAVGLDERRDVRVTKLSGGQQRRVDVALGIVGAPEVLFLDEPTTGFDPEARHQFWELIEELKADGTTILLTTHYLEEAARLADRAGVISGGRLVALDTVDRIGGELARVPRVTWRGVDGRQHDERTERPGELVGRLLAEFGGEPPELEVIRPSLEDIYLSLVGEDRASQRAEATLTDGTRA